MGQICQFLIECLDNTRNLIVIKRGDSEGFLRTPNLILDKSFCAWDNLHSKLFTSRSFHESRKEE